MNAACCKGLAVLVLLAAAVSALWWTTRTRMVYATEPIVRTNVEAAVTAIGVLQPRRYVDVGAQVSG